MDIEVVKKLIEKYLPGHTEYLKRCATAKRYYMNETDILIPEPKKEEGEGKNPIRNADNRIPFNFHGLLVNQKASYMFTAPPLFDIGTDNANKALTDFLGDKYAKVCKDLCIDASNCTVGWIHLWKDKAGKYNYAVVPAEQIIPIWSKNLEKELKGVLRVYQDIDDITGEEYDVYEYWNESECNAYRLKRNEDIRLLQPYYVFASLQINEKTERYLHGIGEVPFFPFFNNNTDTDDLKNIKPLIDAYCKVFSGFVNDLEDIQEVILVLTNYGGEDLGQFVRELKNYKAIQIDNEDGDDKSGVSTLTIELPVEARKELLTVTRKCIFEQGQGIDPDPQNFGNSSGVALGFLYSLLELKAGLQETEFKLGFGRFIRCACRLQGIPIKDNTILQTWTRTSVKNDQEIAGICTQSKGIISDETIIERHPYVENAAKELERLKKQEEEENRKAEESMYGQTFRGKSSDNQGAEQGGKF